MPDRAAHLEVMRPELDGMRRALGRPPADRDSPSFHAFGYKVESLTEMHVRISHSWFDVELELRGSTHGQADDEVEMVFADRLAQWLRSHSEYVASVAAGGEVDPGLIRAKRGRVNDYIAGHRLYAARHHEMVADYCDRMATGLEHRAAELRDSMSCSN